MNTHIGYPTLELWEEHRPYKNSPVYVMLITEPGQSETNGLRTDKLTVVCQQNNEFGEVHYCRIPVGRLSYIGTQPFDPSAQDRKAHAIQAYQLILDWLKEKVVPVVEATIAAPLDYRYLDGHAEFLSYDKETGFTRVNNNGLRN